MRLPDLNKISVWQPIRSTSLSVKSFNNYKYIQEGNVVLQTEQPVFRYAKNYEVGDKVFSLILVSLDPSEAKVEAFMDEVSSEIPLEYCDGQLYKTDITYNP